MELDTEMNKIVAYDLDGVMVPDCDSLPFVAGLDEFYQLMGNVRPIFNPQGDYCIITARSAMYRANTVEWYNKYLSPKPAMLFHEIAENETPEQYKARVLNDYPDITVYIESEPSIVDYLRKNVTTECTIVLFREFIQQQINKI
jgi:hypothetical protein